MAIASRRRAFREGFSSILISSDIGRISKFDPIANTNASETDARDNTSRSSGRGAGTLDLGARH